ncbi:MAG: pteridine reductase [Gammaproteobacteria bacterium]
MQDTGKLAGKTVLITGAARRVGAAVARRLHAEGMRVAIHYRSSSADAVKLAADLNAARADSALTVQADLADLGSLDALIAASLKWGTLDLLVNNASAFHPTPFGTVTGQDWDGLMTGNLKAPYFLAQAAAPHLKRSHGCIVNMVDIYARRPLLKHSVYSLTKAGIAALTRSLALELAPEVRVNGVAPGIILWPSQDMDESARQRLLDSTALKRAGSPADIAAAIVYLVRDADYVTGQTLAVDGGRSIGW